MNNSKTSSLTVALNFLSRSKITASMLKKKMENKGCFESEEIENTINRLLEWKYLDDRSYALSFIKNKKEKSSRKKILYELMKAGIDQQLTKELIEEYYSEEAEHENCLSLAYKLWHEEYTRWENKYRFNPKYMNIAPEVFIRKRVGEKLLLRHYPYSTVISVLTESLLEVT